MKGCNNKKIKGGDNHKRMKELDAINQKDNPCQEPVGNSIRIHNFFREHFYKPKYLK